MGSTGPWAVATWTSSPSTTGCRTPDIAAGSCSSRTRRLLLSPSQEPGLSRRCDRALSIFVGLPAPSCPPAHPRRGERNESESGGHRVGCLVPRGRGMRERRGQPPHPHRRRGGGGRPPPPLSPPR